MGSKRACPQSGEPWAIARLCRGSENSDRPTHSAGAARHHSTPTLVFLLCGLGMHPQKASPYSSLFLGGRDLISEPPTPLCGPTCFPEDGEGCGVPGDVGGREGRAQRHCDLEVPFLKTGRAVGSLGMWVAGRGVHRGAATWRCLPVTPSVLPFSLHDVGCALTPVPLVPRKLLRSSGRQGFLGCRKSASKSGQGGGAVVMRPTFLRGFV